VYRLHFIQQKAPCSLPGSTPYGSKEKEEEQKICSLIYKARSCLRQKSDPLSVVLITAYMVIFNGLS
jgi:hypothetical protein